jgi:hypothetical protein
VDDRAHLLGGGERCFELWRFLAVSLTAQIFWCIRRFNDYAILNLTEPARQEFLGLVVMKGATQCWSWAGEHDADFRPAFRGEKAYRVMYEFRIGDVANMSAAGCRTKVDTMGN